MRMSAWRRRSELTTAPMVVRLACDSIGPRASSSATTISPSLPSVGSSVLPIGAADGDADGDAPGDAEAPADAEADGAGDGDADADGEADGRCATRDGRRATRPRRPRPLAPAEPDGDADGAAVGDRRRLQADRLGLDLDVARAGPDRRGLEVVRGEDRLDLLRRHGRILELDLPARAAGVVDRELQARVRERRDEDEEQARDREERRQRVEPTAFADDVKHRHARGGAMDGPT